MELSLFDYNLPEGYIAYFPAKRRDAARLMVLDRHTGQVSHQKFPEIVKYIGAGDALVINDTRVFKARLFTRRESGGKVEIFLLNELKEAGKAVWEVLTHPSRRVKEGEKLYLDQSKTVEVLQKKENGKTLVKFSSVAEASRLISKYGHVPLPIYIHRPDQKSDETRYQTVYADEKKARAVAAPTAGLHFTNAILEKLRKKGVNIIPITLHVGYGTFKTIKTDNIDEHKVDPEFAEISKTAANALNKVRKSGGKIYAVGTTAVRTLESAPVVDGLIQPYAAATDLYIKPGYQFKLVDRLITNFHLPKSSLIILVAAFAGRETILNAYRIAVEEKYRFYSYGDCMLIL